MKILLVSPVANPIRPESKYVGIERMVWEYARELNKKHKVSVIGHAQSIFPDGVTLLGVEPPSNYPDLELKAFQIYQSLLRSFDVIHDWSHLHLASRFMPDLPSLNIFFHAPSIAQYPKAPYNIIALSQWAAREFKRIYHQEAKYQYSIAIDTSVYKLPDKLRGDRFLTIGRMAEEKGNLDALRVCKSANVPLDIVGGRGFEKSPDEPLSDYEKAVQGESDGTQIKLLGEVSEEEKVSLMQSCRGLIYCPPLWHPEVTSHKIQEAMLCGVPIITQRLGALPEIVTHGVNGFLCDRLDGYITAIQNLDKPDIIKTYEEIKQRFCVETVVGDYVPLYEKVADGLRW